MRRSILLLLLFVSAAAALAVSEARPVRAAAQGPAAAEDITASCFFSVPPDSSGYIQGTGALYDGDLTTFMRLRGGASSYWTAELRGAAAQGVYISWEYAPDSWTLEAYGDRGSSLLSERRGGTGFLQEYVPLPDGTRGFRIVQPADAERPLSVLEISVWSQGVLPDSVHDWDPTPSRCELMVISTHQDDELLFFGGVIPLYAGQRQLDTVVAYMADCGSGRLHEALDGLWTCGLRQYPVFLMLPDVKSGSIRSARRTWNEDDVTDDVARLFLRYRPQVVVTHDVNGEYGHGQHMLTASCTQRALAMCEDPEQAGRLLPGAEPYRVPKCYLHLWEQNEVYMDWENIYLPRLGMTAAEAASEAYAKHVSQHKWYPGVFFGGEYDCARFGLYHSHAGPDKSRDDLFENICQRIENPAAVPDPPGGGFERHGHSGFVYRGSGSGDRTVYIRYGTVNGSADWYVCDSTGALSLVGGQAVRYRSDIFSVIGDVLSPDAARDDKDGPYEGLLADSGILDSRFFRLLSAFTGGDPVRMLAVFSLFFSAALILSVILLSAVVRGRRRVKKRR